MSALAMPGYPTIDNRSTDKEEAEAMIDQNAEHERRMKWEASFREEAIRATTRQAMSIADEFLDWGDYGRDKPYGWLELIQAVLTGTPEQAREVAERSLKLAAIGYADSEEDKFQTAARFL